MSIAFREITFTFSFLCKNKSNLIFEDTENQIYWWILQGIMNDIIY